MEFYRKKSGKSGIPIVPMVDILTILLIFFIVHTQWKQPQSSLIINVPSAEFIKGEEIKQKRAVLAVTHDSKVYLDDSAIEVTQLPTLLMEMKKKNPDLQMQLDVDTDASFGTIVQILDALTAAGIDASDVPARIESGSATTK